MPLTKRRTAVEDPTERMFRHGAVKRSAVLLVLDTAMSDAAKLAYLRAWCADETPQPVAQPDWSELPAYSLPGGTR